MTSQSSPSTRKQSDFTKLLMAGYELKLLDGTTQDFHVVFHGPKETVYENGVWKVHVVLPDDYPFSSPSIGFVNKILHPNIDEASGSVCLDVINQTWTPFYSLVNIFDVFLPQLLTYPNPTDPLNSEAAGLFLRDKTKYNDRVREYVRLHASRSQYCQSNALLPDANSGGRHGRTKSDSSMPPFSESTNDASSSSIGKVETLCQQEVRSSFAPSESTSGSASSQAPEVDMIDDGVANLDDGDDDDLLDDIDD